MKELFAIGSVRSEPEMLPLMDDKILVLKDEVQVGISPCVIMLYGNCMVGNLSKIKLSFIGAFHEL